MRVIIIAHRGAWWPTPQAQNSPMAIELALARGWAVELDVWGYTGALRVHHDRPASDARTADDLPGVNFMRYLPLFKDLRGTSHPRIFLHPKDVHALDWLVAMYRAAGNEWMACSRVIDMELLPDVKPVEYVSCLPPLLARTTDNYPTAELPKWAIGLWWDASQPVIDIPLPTETYYVSRELHNACMDLRMIDAMSVRGVCTDFPQLFAALQSDLPMYPHEKWWAD